MVEFSTYAGMTVKELTPFLGYRGVPFLPFLDFSGR